VTGGKHKPVNNAHPPPFSQAHFVEKSVHYNQSFTTKS